METPLRSDAVPPEKRFTITYEGPALRRGRMDALELGQAIVATARLIERAGSTTLPGKKQISVEVDARFRSGSFVVDYSIVSWVAEHLSAISLTELEVVFTMIFGGGGAIGVLKWLRGRQPDRVTKQDNQVNIRVEGEENIVDVTVFNFLTDEESHEALQGLIGPLKTEGIDEVSISSGTEEPMRIEKDEAKYLESQVQPEETVELEENNVTLEILSPDFREGYKWQFAFGEASFWAEITDDRFLERVAMHDITFGKGDRIRCTMEIETTYRGQEERREHRIVKVHDWIPRDRGQLDMI